MNDNIPSFANARILVVGDVMLDRSITGEVKRISPEAPVPILRQLATHDTAGGAANVAFNIASLGGNVHLLGLIGADDSGQRLRALLAERGIVDGLVTVPTIVTPTKSRFLAQNQQLIRIDDELPSYAQHAHHLDAAFMAALPTCDGVIFSDYNKGTLARVTTWIAAAKRAGKRVFVDPKSVDFARYRGADIVTPNKNELAAAAPPAAGNDIVAQAHALIAAHDLGALLVTRSEEGMSYITATNGGVHFAARAREVFDVTGAGDTVIATLATALAAGYDLPQAITFAGAAAGIVVGKVGTATVTPSELRRALEPQRAASHGILSPAALPSVLAAARAKGEKIVMTNGCFDILHAGHVTYLEEAKALGDRLLVAVNSDASVRRLKGNDRPANTLASRARVLAALAAVDWVVAFEDDTPAELIAAVAPDILVKGGDNKIADIPGAKSVLARGGEVKILSYVDGYSTTLTLAKYQK